MPKAVCWKKNLFWPSLFVFCLSSCFSKKEVGDHSDQENGFAKGRLSGPLQDIQIPQKLVKKIEDIYIVKNREEDPKNVQKDEQIRNNIPREFFQISIILKNINGQALSEDTQFDLPRGGGEIDLDEYVTGEKGSFNVQFKIASPDVEGHDLTGLRLFYVSETKSRVIDSENFGMGCGHFAEVGASKRGDLTGDGFLVNATAQRYLPVIGGTFVFLLPEKERILMALVRIKNSRYKKWDCNGQQ